jgi:hypothetical protein
MSSQQKGKGMFGYDLDILEADCDGMFLLLDTRHNGFKREPEEIYAHIAECDTCF